MTRRLGVIELLLLVAMVAAPFAPAPGSFLLLLALGAAWLATRPPRREAWIAGLAVAAAVAVLAWGFVREPRVSDEAAVTTRLTQGYRGLWRTLESRGELAARAVAGDSAALDRQTLDRPRLQEVLDGLATGGVTLLLVAPDDRAEVWAGEGLLHELDPAGIPADGAGHVASFGAVTLLSVEPLGPAPRPWRLVAARSLVTDRLPFYRGLEPPPERRWSIVGEAAEALPGSLRIGAGAGRPLLVVEPAAGAVSAARPSTAPPREAPGRRLAWAVLAFALLSLAVLRGVGVALVSRSEPAGPPGTARRGWGAVVLALLGSAAAGLAAAVPWPPLAALLVAEAVAVVGLRGAGWHRPLPVWVRSLAGAAAVAATGLVARAWLAGAGPLDLSAGFRAPAGVLALRLALFFLALGLLALAAPRQPGQAAELQERRAWAAVALLLAGAALHDSLLPAALLLLLGGAACGAWLRDRRPLHGAAHLAVLAVLAALTAAGVWETLYRHELKTTLAREVLPAMAPPAEPELAALETEAAVFFDTLELSHLVPRPPDGLERRDLAFQLWKRSPLSMANTFSALVIEPVAGEPSTFSFGFHLIEESGAWRVTRSDVLLPVWEEGQVRGAGELLYRGRPWARISWWLAPRPGFRLDRVRPAGEVGAALLAAGPRAEVEVEGLPEPAVYALYTADGRALVAPWSEAPTLPPGVARAAATGGRSWLAAALPAGRVWAFPQRGPDGIELLYLPALDLTSGLERVGTHALSVLVMLSVLALLGVLLALPRPGFRELLVGGYRSYSKRLIIVYTLLLLLPLVAVDVLLVAAAEERMQEGRREAGLSALDSVQRILVDDMRKLPAGYDLKTALSDDYLSWLAQVVHHDVNLYWENDVWASSKAELFAAGLLPKRIPGEVHARLRRGYDEASRTNRVGRTPYLELYSPVRVPEDPSGQVPLTLSLPLLAQQEEVTEELAALNRQILLVTAALFALLVAVGLRLAKSFTEPIDELVLGTRRIAAGATSLDLAPRELELAALVEAIDEMALRIAQGRQRLVREKQVIERMVESITSGVVSLDRGGRVLLRNKAAAELLGIEVGDTLTGEGAARLPEPVADLVAEAGSEPRQKTVRLTDPDGREREWSLVWVPVPGDGEPAALLVVEDATEVLRAQRLEAWAEMARIIAHEIKNPLTPIRLNAEHMRQVYRRDPDHFKQVFERCVGNILHQVDELQQIAAEFSTYSSILRIEPKEDDLVAAMETLVEPYRSAPPAGIDIRFRAAVAALPARFDRKLLSRAVRNLVENALRASAGGGRVTLSVERQDGSGRISVVDSGPGVEPALLPRIFDPYFSTHDTGTGLGLPIARRVAEEHGGSITAANVPGGGLSVEISIPL